MIVIIKMDSISVVSEILTTFHLFTLEHFNVKTKLWQNNQKCLTNGYRNNVGLFYFLILCKRIF